MRKEFYDQWGKDLPALEKLRRVLAGPDGEQRNGVSFGKRSFEKIMSGDDLYFYGVKEKRLTLRCCEGRFGWHEKNFSDTDELGEQVDEDDAKWILRYGRFEEDFGEV